MNLTKKLKTEEARAKYSEDDIKEAFEIVLSLGDRSACNLLVNYLYALTDDQIERLCELKPNGQHRDILSKQKLSDKAVKNILDISSSCGVRLNIIENQNISDEAKKMCFDTNFISFLLKANSLPDRRFQKSRSSLSHLEQFVSKDVLATIMNHILVKDIIQ